MKIVAGMGSIDDYTDFVNAGADEIFVGYVPERWQVKYGLTTPLNRREVCYYNVQIGARSELEILSDLVQKYHVPVTIAFNGLHFREEQYPLIADIMMECLSLGFQHFIVADLGLLIYLHEHSLTDQFKIHLSGEYGEINHFMLEEFVRLGISRLIFHRKVSLENMRAIISKMDTPLEYEAFILNENCHFHGGFCNTMHSDDLIPMCRMPYRLTSTDNLTHHDESLYDYGTAHLNELKNIGITHLKIVGRGAGSDEMISSINHLRELL